uniref:Secreted protein n=1 Tax=Caenorhabditis tropicalis TaxID=1561998 RepID=A0A1I7TRA0_9PELO
MGQLFLFSLCILAGCLSAGPLPSRETYGLTYGCDICRIFGGCPRRAFSSSDRDDGYYPEQLKHGDLTRASKNDIPLEDNENTKPQFSKIANNPPSKVNNGGLTRGLTISG